MNSWIPALFFFAQRMEVVQKSGDFGTPIYGKVRTGWEMSEPHMARKGFLAMWGTFLISFPCCFRLALSKHHRFAICIITATKNQASKYRKTPAPALPTTHYRGSDLHLMAQSIGLSACVLLLVLCGGSRGQIIYGNEDRLKCRKVSKSKFATSIGVSRTILSHAHALALGCDFEGTTSTTLCQAKSRGPA